MLSYQTNSVFPIIYPYSVQLDIGTGQFGTVKEGVWQEEDGRSTKVALKSLKHDCAPDDKLKFLQEAAIMAQFRHPNIIMVFGVVVESQPVSDL